MTCHRVTVTVTGLFRVKQRPMAHPVGRRWPAARGLETRGYSRCVFKSSLSTWMIFPGPRRPSGTLGHCYIALFLAIYHLGYIAHWQAKMIYSYLLYSTLCYAMQCESHFNPSFGNVFNLKKIKLSLSPSPQWPQAALRLGGDGRQVS